MAKVKLDPKRQKTVAQIGPYEKTRKISVTFDGLWQPKKSAKNWVGPEGHPTKKLGKKRKWCVLVFRDVISAEGSSRRLLGTGKGPFEVRRHPKYFVHVVAVMLDDMMTDNRNHSDQPMTAYIKVVAADQ